MKELVALLFLVCFGGATFYFSIIKKLDSKTAVSFLIFSLASGISIANYDIIKKLKWGDVEIETWRQDQYY
jgi:hypothetical protein